MFKENNIVNGPVAGNDQEKEDSLQSRKTINLKINQLFDDYFESKNSINDGGDKSNKVDNKDNKETINNFILSLRNLAMEEDMEGNIYNLQRAWSQEQVDKVLDILNQSTADTQLLNILLFEVFTTNKKNGEEESKGKTVSDLFAKSIINKLDGDGVIKYDLLGAISNWGQNIHMIDPDILLKFIITINNHPEKVSVDMRYQITMGIGLFDSLLNNLDGNVEKLENISDQLKNLELLRNLASLSNVAGFQKVGHKASELICKKTKETNNYFIKTRGQQIAATSQNNQRSEWLRLKDKYSDAKLAQEAPLPLLYENNLEEPEYFKQKTLNGSHYNQLNKEVGVIYNNLFEVDSFFDIKNNKRLSLDLILEREGYSVANNSPKDLEKIKLTYKTLIGLPLRDRIEEEFGLDLSNFSTREQLQFINFISSENINEIDRTKKFISGSSSSAGKDNRFISFLSLETDNGIGKKIIEIGEKFSKNPESADLLFLKYAELTRCLTAEADKFEDLYQSIYFDKNINRGEIIKLLLIKSNGLLLKAHEKIKDLSPQESEREVGLLIRDLDSEILEKKKYLDELKETALRLNDKYNNLGHDLIAALDPTADYRKFEEEQTSGDINLSPEINNILQKEIAHSKKYDSERLKSILDYYQTVLEKDIYINSKDEVVIEEFIQEKEKFERGEISQEELLNNFKDSDLIFYEPAPEEKVIYEEAIKKITPILPLQLALEKKIDRLVYGREEVKLPKGFGDFENNKVVPENIPEQAPLYFPVGISKDLPAWESVFNGDKKVAKPIDLYGYLFWLNNQGQKVRLVICDEIQVNNYQVRYGKSENEARRKAIEIGDHETKQYEKIISSFDLNNITIQRYPEFINENKEEYGRYSEIVKKLAIQPTFREAFLAMVQESVSGAEKEDYIGYALEELAWILSTNGTKVGHLNEARYDILATVIRNFEQVGRDQDLDVLNNPESPKAKIILSTVCKLTRDAINEKKSKLDRNSSSLAYFQRLQDHLGKIKIDSKVGFDKSVKKDSLSLNFVCPDVGSASFGFRGDFEAKESVVKFKEPYSTYFYKTDTDLLINSDQVVAASEGLISGKILTLENNKQLKYAESVVRPILKHFFSNLDRTPEEYFQTVGKNREELKQEGKEMASLLEAIRFIQKYIVKPTQLV